MININSVDKNFHLENVGEKDVLWRNALESVFSLHGVFYDFNENRYRRMDGSVSSRVSEGVEWLSTHTAGGRIRFTTDSSFVAIYCKIPNNGVMNHMTIVGMNGFSIYENGVYSGMITPSYEQFSDKNTKEIEFDGICRLQNVGLKKIEIYFPLYNGVNELFIGVKKTAFVEPYAYPQEGKICFYGSSITQGGCASRPGNDYISLLSRWLNTDVVNFGFSGNARGETVMAEYIAKQKSKVFVLDYDYNSPKQDLCERHYAFYKIVRRENPLTPILFISKPDFEYDAESGERREIIYETYKKAKRNKDRKVAFLDGELLFGKFGRDGCTVDTCHPNDLGFYRMAEKIYPILKRLLKKENVK